MLECLIMGDSIALGIGQHIPECIVSAKVGASSKAWLSNNREIIAYHRYKNVYISLGSNDMWNTTSDTLYFIRKNIKAEKVYWILTNPSLKPKQRVIIKEIANEFKDATIEITKYLGYDGMHPTPKGYKELAFNIKNNIY